eukprot:SAG31_NODE_8623_length_1418_cov_1.110690_2_plen_106_part_00
MSGDPVIMWCHVDTGDADWRDLKDYLREGGAITFANNMGDGNGVAEFETKQDMEDAIDRLDDKKWRGEYLRIRPEGSGRGGGGGSRRSRYESKPHVSVRLIFSSP